MGLVIVTWAFWASSAFWLPSPGLADSSKGVSVPWRLDYFDGSANAYHLWQDKAEARFEYEPVKPEESSTGMYSGGKPRSGRLDPKNVEELWARVRSLESDATLRAESRMKGTGAFRVKDPGGTREFLIQRSPPLLDFDRFLDKLTHTEGSSEGSHQYRGVKSWHGSRSIFASTSLDLKRMPDADAAF